MDSDQKDKNAARHSLKENQNDQLYTGVSDLFRQNNGVILFRRAERKAEAESVADEIEEMLVLLKGLAEADKGAREIRANHRSVTGWINGDYGAVPFESTVEMDFAYLALFDARVTGLHAQPITINYYDEDEHPRHYTPDFLVEYLSADGGARKALVEIKLSSELREHGESLSVRFRAAEYWCLQNGFEFHLVTDEQIRAECIDNIKALYPFRFATNYRNSALWDLDEKIKSAAPISIEEVLQQHSSAPVVRAEIQKLIWILIARQSLHINLGERWSAKTTLHTHPVWHDPNLFFTTSHEIGEV